MGIFENIRQQTTSGQIICAIIFLCFILYFIFERIKVKWLSNLHKDLYRHIEREQLEEEPSFSENSFLEKVLRQFVDVKAKNPDVANLDSIIEKETPKKIVLIDKTLKFFPNLMVSLGLLGTFIGLQSSIALLIGAFSGQNLAAQEAEDLRAFSQFMEVIRSPLASMSTAFITSILGLICSLIATLTHNLVFSARESHIYGEMIDYCENILGARYENKLDRAIMHLRVGIKESIDTFSGNVKQLSLDLSSSVTTIHASMVGLNNAIEGMNSPINQFTESIDIFNQSCSTLDQQVSAIRQISDDLSLVIGTTMKAGIDDFVLRMGNVTEHFAREVDIATDKLGVSMTAGVSGINALLVEVENSLKESTKTHEEMNESLMTLGTVHKEYLVEVKSVNEMMDATKKVLFATENTIQQISGEVIRGISESFQLSALQMSKDTVSVLQENMGSIMNETRDIIIGTKAAVTKLSSELLPEIGKIHTGLIDLVESVKEGNIENQKKTIENLKGLSDVLNNSYNRYATAVTEFHDLSEILTRAIGTMSGAHTRYDVYSN